MKRVEVEWVDSSTHCETPWTSKQDLDKKLSEPLTCTSTGYLYAERDDRIVIVLSDAGTEYGVPLEIPREAVRSVTELVPKAGNRAVRKPAKRRSRASTPRR